MITLLISIAALILGYFVYGRFVEKVFGPDKNRLTPAHSKADGIDYVLLPSWKVFMIQFLNIAGTGPIFGAILGARFGPSCYLACSLSEAAEWDSRSWSGSTSAVRPSLSP